MSFRAPCPKRHHPAIQAVAERYVDSARHCSFNDAWSRDSALAVFNASEVRDLMGAWWFFVFTINDLYFDEPCPYQANRIPIDYRRGRY